MDDARAEAKANLKAVLFGFVAFTFFLTAIAAQSDPEFTNAHTTVAVIIGLVFAWHAGAWRLFARRRWQREIERIRAERQEREIVLPAAIAHRMTSKVGDVPDKDTLTVVTGKCRHCGGSDIKFKKVDT